MFVLDLSRLPQYGLMAQSLVSKTFSICAVALPGSPELGLLAG